MPFAAASRAAAARGRSDELAAGLDDQYVVRSGELHRRAARPVDRAVIGDRRGGRAVGLDADATLDQRPRMGRVAIGHSSAVREDDPIARGASGPAAIAAGAGGPARTTGDRAGIADAAAL